MFGRPRRNVSLYAKLGLTQEASASEIQQAYSHFLELYTTGDAEKKSGSKKKIKEIQRAYEVLSNPETRATYDQHGSVGRWVKIKRMFSPEYLDKRGACVQGLWSCFFGATCCCCFYCFGNCCGLCQYNNKGADDEDDIYVRHTFSEYVVGEPDSCPGCLTSRRMRKESREAARRRRKDFWIYKQDMRTRRCAEDLTNANVDEGSNVIQDMRTRQCAEDETNATVDDAVSDVSRKDTVSVHSTGSKPKSRRNKNKLISKDSGYGVGINNMSFEEDESCMNNNRHCIPSGDDVSEGNERTPAEIKKTRRSANIQEDALQHVQESTGVDTEVVLAVTETNVSAIDRHGSDVSTTPQQLTRGGRINDDSGDGDEGIEEVSDEIDIETIMESTGKR